MAFPPAGLNAAADGGRGVLPEAPLALESGLESQVTPTDSISNEAEFWPKSNSEKGSEWLKKFMLSEGGDENDVTM